MKLIHKCSIAAFVVVFASCAYAMTPGKPWVPPNDEEIGEIVAECRCEPQQGIYIGYTFGMALNEAALWHSAGRGDYEAVFDAMNHGANPNVTPPTEVPDHADAPIHCALRNGYARVAGLLCKRGASIEQPGCEGEHPLHAAVDSGCLASVKLLLRCGADCDATDDYGATALYAAAVYQLASEDFARGCLSALLEAGADPNKAACAPWAEPGLRHKPPLVRLVRCSGYPELFTVLCHHRRTMLFARDDLERTAFQLPRNVCDEGLLAILRRALAVCGRELVLVCSLLRREPALQGQGSLMQYLIRDHIGPFLFSADDVKELLPRALS